MADIARKVCMTIGKELIANDDGAQHILRMLIDDDRGRYDRGRYDDRGRMTIAYESYHSQ